MPNLRAALQIVVLATVSAALGRASIDFSMAMTGVEGVASRGVYVGTYYGQADGSAIDIYCDDYFHESYVGQKWQAYRSTLDDLTLTRFGNVSGAATKYREAMWLVEQFGNHPTSDWGVIHAALWDIFSPSAFIATPEIDHWLSLAALPSNEGSINPNAFYIYTPSNPSIADSQEFLSPIPPSQVLAPSSQVAPPSPQQVEPAAQVFEPAPQFSAPAAVPEPESIWLLVTIVLMLAGNMTWRLMKGRVSQRP